MRNYFLLGVVILLSTLSACGKKPTPVATPTAPTASASVPAPPVIPIPPPPTIPGNGYVLIDFASGQTLAAQNENERLEPASLTKIMTAYAVFDALRSGSIKLSDNATISEHAWRVGGGSTDGSTSFLPVHSQAPIEILLQGMIVQSGNDASIALAERVGGSEEAFAHLMNAYAKRLGMTGTNFENSTGLPAPNHFTTARDMAVLAQAIIRDFPQYYHYFSEREFMFNNIKQGNRNGLLSSDPSVDGLKTGHTEKAGYCLVTSAKRSDMRLISVVMKTPSVKARESASAALLNYGFTFFESQKLLSKGQVIGKTRVWQGAQNEVSLAVSRDVIVTMPRGRASQLQTTPHLPPSVVAPVTTQTAIGSVVVTLDGKTLVTEPLYAQTEVPAAGFFSRMIDSIRMKFE